MTVQCMPPDPNLGVALRLAGYLECQSRALGENGFQALTGGPVMTAMLSGVVTIFIALIGYRMILGSIPGVRDGIGWAVRLGMVLTLVTSWPAFQTLVYHVVTDGPQELGAVILPAAGLSADSMDDRIQEAYDEIRLGLSPVAKAQPQGSSPQLSAGSTAGLQAMPAPALPSTGAPQTASLFVMSTSGLIGALRIVVGFLVAIGPIAALCLLFQGTISIFDGWIRALVGAAFGMLAASITTTIELVVIESELAHEHAVQVNADAASSLDPQALVTIVLFFVVVALAAVYASTRVASAFRLPTAAFAAPSGRTEASSRDVVRIGDPDAASRPPSGTTASDSPRRTRTTAVADALATAAYRDQGRLGGQNTEGSARPMTIRQENGGMTAAPIVPLGVAGRRSTGRRTQSARRRDMPA